ncbi:MAG TPA: hypothetical protein VGM40_04650 [Mycobacterium sp.]|jgi:hypothetical protein
MDLGTADAAQAVELVRALRAKVDEMSVQLALVEHRAVSARSASMALALRSEAAALRRDIAEALFLITRLQHRYPNVDDYTRQPPRRPQPKPRR